MWRVFGAIVLGAGIFAAATVPARADDQKTEIKGGIEGKIKKVDVDGNKLTITMEQGRERTFTITDETTMIGPRGGKVRKHLKDHRFREGFPVIIVAQGATASEVHLGFAKDAVGGTAEHTKSTSRTSERTARYPDVTPSRNANSSGANATDASPTNQPSRKQDSTKVAKTDVKRKTTTEVEEVDEDNEVPGKVKTFDATRRHLVITLLNGKSRSFFLSKDVQVIVKGKASTHGLEDPTLKAGAAIEVVTDEGGHKVKELKIVPASEIRSRKAG
jgi:hypothetical protein